MIIYFKVANYKSIKEPIIINFQATSISEHTEANVIQHGKERLLKSIVLYGDNASGKSKLLDALACFQWLISNSATEMQSSEKINVEPFALNEATANSPSYFEMSFVIGQLKYRYGFEADQASIRKEWLLESKATKEYPVFLRIDQEIEVDYKRFLHAEDLDKRTRKNALFLSVAAQWNVLKAQEIDQWIANIMMVKGLEDKDYRAFTIELLKNKTYAALITNFIRKADLGISAIDVVDMPKSLADAVASPAGERRDYLRKDFIEHSAKTVFAIHHKYNDDTEIVDSVPLVLDTAESEGTKKYFNIIGVLLTALLESRVVVIDEFDARLHTLLAKAILKLFNSSLIQSNAQMIVASHDTALLDRELLRRDQIYFIEKDIFGASSALSLVEYKPRKDSPYDKNYLEGKYGGIPFIEDLEILIANEQN